jgi:hypothetical protein
MKITLMIGFLSDSTNFRHISTSSALIPFQTLEVDPYRSKNIVHQLNCRGLYRWYEISTGI